MVHFIYIRAIDNLYHVHVLFNRVLVSEIRNISLANLQV